MHATGQIVHTGKWGMPHQQFKKGNGTLQQETCMCGSGNPKGVGFSSKVPLVAPTLTQPWHNAMVQMRGCGVWGTGIGYLSLCSHTFAQPSPLLCVAYHPDQWEHLWQKLRCKISVEVQAIS